RRQRILRPRMLWVAAAQVGTDVFVTTPPETRQTARDLDRPVCWRQQLDHQRYAAGGNSRMHCKTEQLLYADRQFRALLRLIVDRHMRAGRRAEMGRCFGVKAPAQVPWQKSVERSGKIAHADLRQRGLADEKGREPFGCRARQYFIRQIRPFISFRSLQKIHAIAELLLRLAPRELADAQSGDTLGQKSGVVVIRRNRLCLFGKDQCAKPAASARAQRGGSGVERYCLAVLDLTREAGF